MAQLNILWQFQDSLKSLTAPWGHTTWYPKMTWRIFLVSHVNQSRLIFQQKKGYIKIESSFKKKFLKCCFHSIFQTSFVEVFFRRKSCKERVGQKSISASIRRTKMATSKYDQNALQLVHIVHCCLLPTGLLHIFFCQGLEISEFI